jgi:hypothetical protein
MPEICILLKFSLFSFAMNFQNVLSLWLQSPCNRFVITETSTDVGFMDVGDKGGIPRKPLVKAFGEFDVVERITLR